MSNNEYWKSFIRIAFESTINKRFLMTNGPIRLLIVESKKSDGLVYKQILEEQILVGDQLISAKIEDDHIFDPNCLLSFLRENDGLNIGNYYKGFDTNEMKDPLNWDAVIDIVDDYLNNEEAYKKYDLYGFIDQDTEGHNIKGRPISMTEMHDCETNIIRKCFNKYISNLLFKEEISKTLPRIIEFAYVQGLLEKESFEYGDSFIAWKLQIITHQNFFNEGLLRLFDEAQDDIKDSFKTYLNSKNSSFVDDEKGEYHSFKKSFYSSLEKEASFDMKTLISRWLNFATTNDDERILNYIFRRINGHVFLELLYHSVGKYLEIDGLSNMWEKKRESMIVNRVLHSADSANLRCMQTINPVKEYAQYLARLKRT